jgi:oligopeptide/dipeptide ABC transporter ATP-binding protein
VTALLEAHDLVKHFPVTTGVLFNRTQGYVHAVDGVSLSVEHGETLGLVGETGCGKSTTARLLTRLLEPTSGEIRYDGADITHWSQRKLRPLRRDVQMIFQDPYSSLNPRRPVGTIIGEPLRIHGIGTKQDRRLRVRDVMSRVGLNPEHYNRYVHEFSGGQRQRIGIARAIVTNPKLIVADEPVSALDVSIQAQVINLLEDLQKQFNLTYLFIAHDLSVVEHISTRVAVMYLGKIVEIAPAKELYNNPKHPYTEALLSAVPIPDPAVKRKRIILEGDVPSPIKPPSGCRFHTRCSIRVPSCSENEQVLKEISRGHWVACQVRS